MAAVGLDAVIKIGAKVDTAIAGIVALQSTVITLDAKTNAAASHIVKATKRMGEAFVVLGAIIGVILIAAVRKSMKTFSEYEQAVANAASVTGTAGDEFVKTTKNIDDMSKTLGATTVFSAKDAASALYDIASMGYNVTDMVSGDLKPVLDLAAATQSDLTRTTEHVTASLGQFGLTMSDSSRVSDVFARTISSSKATLEKIGLSMKYAGVISYQFGEDIESVSAALGIMYNTGLRGEQAGRSLRMSLGRLSAPTKVSAKVIRGLGLTLKQVNPEFNTMTEIFHTLHDAGITTSQSMILFGKEAATGIGAVMQNLPLLEKLEEKIRDSGGAAEDMAYKQLDTLHGTLILVKSAVENLEIEIGEQLSPALRRGLQWFRLLVLEISAKVKPAFDKLKETLVLLEPSLDSLGIIGRSIKGILIDMAIAFGVTDEFAKNLTDSINKLTGWIAVFLYYVDQHPTVTKLGMAVLGVAISFIILFAAAIVATPIIGGAAAALTGLSVWAAVAFSSVEMLAISIYTLLGPVGWLILAISLLGTAWALDLGRTRELTSKFFGFMVDLFFGFVNFVSWLGIWMIEHNPIMAAILKILGVDLVKSDIDEVRGYFSRAFGSLFDIDGIMAEYNTKLAQEATYDEILQRALDKFNLGEDNLAIQNETVEALWDEYDARVALNTITAESSTWKPRGRDVGQDYRKAHDSDYIDTDSAALGSAIREYLGVEKGDILEQTDAATYRDYYVKLEGFQKGDDEFTTIAELAKLADEQSGGDVSV